MDCSCLTYIFSQIVLDINASFFSFFRTRNFMNKKLRNVSLCKKQLPICHLYTLKKTTHKHVAFTVFLYRQKVSSSPESYSPKNGVLSYFIASIDLELFTTSPKPPIFNLSNNKSIINFLTPTPPHFSSKLELTFIDCPMEYHL